MNTLEVLHTRSSIGKLSAPAPQGDALANILKAAVRASDHQRLHPWKFLVVEGDAREKLGKVFVDVAMQTNPAMTAEEQADMIAKTLRAPMIIIVVAKVRPHPKVPDIEQLLSAGAAAQLMLVAAHAQGFGGMWRTGGMAYSHAVNQRLGLEQGDQIVGFLYLGTSPVVRKPADIDYRDYTVVWNG
jgi:nitroreductase